MVASLGKNALLAKMDVLSAFRLLISSSSVSSLKITISSTNACLWAVQLHVHSLEKLSTFLEWAAKTSSRKEEIEHYLDDFLLAGRVGTKDCDFKCQVYGKSVRN